MSDVVERELYVQATVERVWEVITDEKGDEGHRTEDSGGWDAELADLVALLEG